MQKCYKFPIKTFNIVAFDNILAYFFQTFKSFLFLIEFFFTYFELKAMRDGEAKALK